MSANKPLSRSNSRSGVRAPAAGEIADRSRGSIPRTNVIETVVVGKMCESARPEFLLLYCLYTDPRTAAAGMDFLISSSRTLEHNVVVFSGSLLRGG